MVFSKAIMLAAKSGYLAGYAAKHTNVLFIAVTVGLVCVLL